MQQQPLGHFLDRLASARPAPGGGSAAAVMGAMGAALVSMVANLTIGKRPYAEVEDEVAALREQAEALRLKLTCALQQDVDAYLAVMAAYALAKETPAQQAARSAAIQTALQLATEVPLACARLALEALPLAGRIAQIGNAHAVADAGVAAIAAQGALRSAVLNVLVNIAAIQDQAFSAPRRAEAEQLMVRGAALEANVFDLVRCKIAGA